MDALALCGPRSVPGDTAAPCSVPLSSPLDGKPSGGQGCDAFTPSSLTLHWAREAADAEDPDNTVLNVEPDCGASTLGPKSESAESLSNTEFWAQPRTEFIVRGSQVGPERLHFEVASHALY